MNALSARLGHLLKVTCTAFLVGLGVEAGAVSVDQRCYNIPQQSWAANATHVVQLGVVKINVMLET